MNKNIKIAWDKGLLFYGKPCPKNHDGLRYKSGHKECIYCSKVKAKKFKWWRDAYRLKNKDNPEYKEKQAESQRKWRLNNPITYMLRTAKARAKDRGLVFDLVDEDITIPEYCPVLGIKLEQIISTGGRGTTKKWSSASLDRKDNTKGYVKDNVQVISWRANMLKNNATVDELEKIVNYLKGN